MSLREERKYLKEIENFEEISQCVKAVSTLAFPTTADGLVFLLHHVCECARETLSFDFSHTTTALGVDLFPHHTVGGSRLILTLRPGLPLTLWPVLQGENFKQALHRATTASMTLRCLIMSKSFNCLPLLALTLHFCTRCNEITSYYALLQEK